MSVSIPTLLPITTGLANRQIVQMREHLAQHYHHKYREHVTYHELRDAGQQAIVATMPFIGDSDAITLATFIYRQIRNAIVRYVHDARHEK